MLKSLIVLTILSTNLGTTCFGQSGMGEKPEDVLGVLGGAGLPPKTGQAKKSDAAKYSANDFDAGDGWKIILIGEEIRRPASLQRVAMTRAEVKFDSEEALNKFFDIIKESDARLSKVPDAEVMYDWQNVRRKGNTVRFGVAWYDTDFFASRKDAHKSQMHQRIFERFGVSPEKIRIEHIPLQPISTQGPK